MVPVVDLDRTLRALASAGVVVAVSALPGVMGLGPGDAAGVLAGLIGDDLVELWPSHPGGPAVVLSGLAAARIGVELSLPESGQEAWIPTGTARGERPLRTRGVSTEADVFAPDGAGLDSAPDLCRDGLPWLDTPRARAAAVHLGRLGAPPEPLYWRGSAATWPIAPGPDGSCGGCGGRPLPTRVGCLVCLRTGVDAMLPVVPTAERPKPYRPDPGGLGGGKGAQKGAKRGKAKGKRRKAAAA